MINGGATVNYGLRNNRFNFSVSKAGGTLSLPLSRKEQILQLNPQIGLDNTNNGASTLILAPLTLYINKS